MCFEALCCKYKSRNFERSCSQNSDASQPLLLSSNTEVRHPRQEAVVYDINSITQSFLIDRDLNIVDGNPDQNYDTTVSSTLFPM